MKNFRQSRKLGSDRSGVSEILGDILLVVMSVVMLSALAAQLLSMPPPAGLITADTTASYDGKNLTIEHLGGNELRDPYIAVQVGKGPAVLAKYTIAQGNADGLLKIGENWKRDISSVVGPDDRVYVAIIDTKNHRVLSSQYVERVQDYSNLPDIGLAVSDISFWREGHLIDEGANAPMINDDLTINLTIHNYGKVNATNVQVATSVFLYATLPLAQHTIPFLNASGNPGANVTISVQWIVGDWGPHTVFVRVIPLYNESVFTNNYAKKIVRIGPGITTPNAPDLNITALYFSNSHPQHGDAVKVYVRIANQGGIPANVSLTYRDNAAVLFTDVNISVSSGQLLEVYTVWIPTCGGLHTIYTNVSVLGGLFPDANLLNNERSSIIEVLPTILLVDDDKAGDGGLKDTVSSMKAAMSAVGAQYTYYNVGGGDGPMFDVGPVKKRLVDFDLVIWMSGFESTNTMTKNDIANVTRYLGAGGKLWLIGQDIVDDLRNTNATFLTNYLHVQSYTLNSGTPNPLMGYYGNNVTALMNISMKPLPWASGLSDKGDVLVPDGKSVGALRNNGTGNNCSLMFNDTTNGTPGCGTYRLALFAFEFSQIRSQNDRAILTYEMLKWFDALARWGRDLALADQVLTSLNPAFMEEVNITVYLRNNGPDDEPMGSDRVAVLFNMDGMPMPAYKLYIDGVLQSPGNTTNPVEVPSITAYGGQRAVTMTWVANRVGSHSIKVQVDPFDFIEEIDETNNEVWGASGTLIKVRYSLLVVDDDDSANNRVGSLNYNSSADLTRALDRLGYTYTSQVVSGVAADGPNETYLERFNAVIWLTGQCIPGAPNPLTANDETALGGYMGAGDNRGFWLIAQDAYANGNYAAGSFVFDYLHVQTVTRNQNTPGPLYGVKNDPIGHGVNYNTARTFGPVNGGCVLAPRADAAGATYNSPATSTYNSVRYYSTSMGYRSFYCGWEFGFIDGKSGTSEVEYESEFAYMVLHWMGMPDTRTELRVTDVDLYYSSMVPMSVMNPAMGNSYVIKAVLANIGGTRGDCSVRFTDGKTVIGTTFVSTGPDGNSIAEIVWTPLFAGLRTIAVQADPDATVPEIMTFNDIASVTTRTYFFYDDMENGTRNWRHESTILRINGESPLEYLDVGNVSTGVISSWHYTQGFSRNTTEYHSMNSSFGLKEPGPPLDLVLVMDISKSMTGTPMASAQAAACTLVNMSTNDTRVAIYHSFSSAGQRQHLTFTTLNAAGRTTVINSINALSTQAYTQLWLTSGEAITYCDANHRTNAVPAVVILSDGQDFQGADDAIADPPAASDFNKCEYGSNDGYCPWLNWGSTNNFGTPGHWGKYFGTASREGWWNRCDFGGGGNDADGLLNPPLSVFAVGLNIEHDANFPNFDAASTVAAGQRTGDRYTGASVTEEYWEAGTPEYNLYRLATTSVKGKYFYAPSSAELAGVFDEVAAELADLQSVVRSSRDAGAPQEPALQTAEGGASARGANVPGDGDQHADTTTFSLVNVSGAKLCFWNKYNLLMGYSGAVILVGNSTDNITFNYRYMTPSQAYTGNILMSTNRLDDLGNEIRWCWNGVSGNGAYSWEYVEVNLNQFIGQQYVRAMFAYIRAGGGGGKGWFIDDVEVKVSRSDSVTVQNTSADQWELVTRGATLGSGGDTADAYSGDHAWLCHNPSPSVDYLKPGIDNSLITIPIDLTSALDARLEAYLKFNINFTEGRPPDGFRVEVSSDGGVQWKPITFGVRSAWRVSGSEAAGPDGKSFTGVNEGGNWTKASSLSRLNCDLTGWAGEVVLLRFRVVTRNDAVNHYESAVGFGGFYIDNVMVIGNTTTGGRAPGRALPEQTSCQSPAQTGIAGPPLPVFSTDSARMGHRRSTHADTSLDICDAPRVLARPCRPGTRFANGGDLQ